MTSVFNGDYIFAGIQSQDSVVDRYMDDLIQVILKILDTDSDLFYYQVSFLVKRSRWSNFLVKRSRWSNFEFI